MRSSFVSSFAPLSGFVLREPRQMPRQVAVAEPDESTAAVRHLRRLRQEAKRGRSSLPNVRPSFPEQPRIDRIVRASIDPKPFDAILRELQVRRMDQPPRAASEIASAMFRLYRHPELRSLSSSLCDGAAAAARPPSLSRSAVAALAASNTAPIAGNTAPLPSEAAISPPAIGPATPPS